MTVTEAKAELAEVIRSAEAGQRVIITRHGKPVAAVVEYDAIAQLKRIEAINYRELWPVKPATNDEAREAEIDDLIHQIVEEAMEIRSRRWKP